MFDVPWIWSGGWSMLWAAIGYAVVVAATVFVASIIVPLLVRIFGVKSRLKTGLVTLIVYALVFPLMAFGLSLITRTMSEPTDYTPSAQTVAKELGLESGRSYPLFVGTQDSDHNDLVMSGLFTLDSLQRLRAGKSVPFTFTTAQHKSYLGEAYPLRISANDIKVVESPTEGASVRVFLLSGGSNDGLFNGANVDRKNVGRRCSINNLIYRCKPIRVSEKLTLSSGQRDTGLMPIVNRYVDRVEITLSRGLYHRLLELPDDLYPY